MQAVQAASGINSMLEDANFVANGGSKLNLGMNGALTRKYHGNGNVSNIKLFVHHGNICTL